MYFRKKRTLVLLGVPFSLDPEGVDLEVDNGEPGQELRMHRSEAHVYGVFGCQFDFDSKVKSGAAAL